MGLSWRDGFLYVADRKNHAIRRVDDATGQVKGSRVVHLDTETAGAVSKALESADFTVTEVADKPFVNRPWAPFMTSTLQQEAARKLRFAAQKTMRVAQSLYESGYITYMRTDSTALSETAVAAARALIGARFGPRYLPDRPRVYTNRVRNAQEAHEAIRPAGEAFRDPAEVAAAVPDEQARLYDLIWRRTVASQMADAVGESVQVRLGARSASGTPGHL